MADIIRTGQTEIISAWDERFDKENFEAEGHEGWVRAFMPITLRGESIGLVEAGFKKGGSEHIQEARISLLKSLINQTAIALDNAQRYEIRQKALRREQTIREITDRLRAAPNLDRLLEIATEELSDRFSATHARLKLGIKNKNQ